jgi:phosphatidylinositol glycan class B
MIRTVNTYFNNWSFETKIRYGSLLVFLVTAFFNIGHHASDEHYQILEFAQYKSGNISADGLAWEFSEKMRSSLQPWIAFLSIKFLNSLGIINPFFITLLFRIASAILSWIIIGKLNKVIALKYFPAQPWRHIFHISTYLLWFVPYISARFSSENFSAIFLLAGVYCIVKKEINLKRAILAGIFLGLSVLFRYQVGIAVLGIFACLIFFERLPFKKILWIGLPILFIMLFGVFLDYLFYNEFVLTTLNYFKLNLVEGRASDFGTKPWWFYFAYFIIVGIPPLSLILFLSFFAGIIQLPKNIFTCIIIPFVFIHLLIPHKEIRFLFPVFYPFIFLAVYGLQAFFRQRPIRKYQVRIFKTGVVLNFVVLSFRMLLPANEKVNYYRYLYNNIEKGDYLIITTEKDAYDLVGNLNASFYKPPSSRSLHFSSMKEAREYLEANNIQKCFFLNRDYSKMDIPGYRSEMAYSIYPRLLKKIASENIEKRIKPWSIYIITKEKAD